MPARKNSYQSLKMSVFIAGGLLIGMTSIFPPKIHGANGERMGMIESADHGATWQFKGHADFYAPELNPVDPSALFDNGLLVFYFFDLNSLGTDTAVVYRSVAADGDGLDFSPPARAFKFAGAFTDPFVLKLPDGRYRMYIHGQNAILSATSSDGFVFNQDPGERTRAGGVPGAVALYDKKIRLFVSNQQGMISLISGNGLDFTQESGARIPLPPGAGVVSDPSPILCGDGKYRMAYKVRPIGQGESPVLDEVHLAESTDALNWTPGSASLVTGSVPTLVELPDGRLRIYYVDFKSDETASLLKFVKTVQVTPDADFQSAAFARVGYVPATNKLAVTFGGAFKHAMNNLNGGYAYKEYTLDMQATGKSGALYGTAGDIGGIMVGNQFYAANMDKVGWRIVKFDAVSWEKLADITCALDTLSEMNGDMMLAFVNGQLDVSSQTLISGKISPPGEGAGTHHHFFTPDLDFLGNKILSDTSHITGSSMIYADNIYYFVSATAYTGDVIVMKYDSDWKYLGSKKLISQGHWSEGLAYDGERFFIAYLDTRQRTETTFFPYYPNVHVAAFDRDWNLLEDAAVTNFAASDSLFTGRPSLLLHGNRVYVSYDVVPLPEDLNKIEAYVSVYEIMQGSSSVRQAEEGPGEFRLEQNYPNPFNPSTTIRFSLTRAAYIRLTIFDLLGREVAVLADGKFEEGVHDVRWVGLDSRHAPVPSGVYLVRLEAAPYRATGKLLLLK
jgi:hypothetical protein